MKAYVQQGLRRAQALGQGPGPVAHEAGRVGGDFRNHAGSTQNNGVWQLETSLAVAAFPATNHQLGLYPVVDSVQWIEKLLQWGVRTLQFAGERSGCSRSGTADTANYKKLGQQYQARLFINDYWQLAVRAWRLRRASWTEDLQIADLNAIRDAGLRLGISTHGF